MSKRGVAITKGYRSPRKRIASLEHQNGLPGKTCTKCDVWKRLESFAKKSNGIAGRNSQCKECKNAYKREWDAANTEHNQAYHLANKERRNEMSREWKGKNPDRLNEYRRKWAMTNPEKKRLSDQKRAAIKKGLPDTLTESDMQIAVETFGGCALTGNGNFQWDHVIPLNVGHGGTTAENMIPLTSSLNFSKNDRNIFEWFEANRQRFDLSQERFDNLLAWLASANAMSVDEYRDYVNYCHENPRTIDELKEEAQ